MRGMDQYTLPLFQDDNEAPRATWGGCPATAFDDWLSEARHGHGRPYNPQSTKVYSAMWATFVRHLIQERKSLLTMSSGDVMDFLEAEGKNTRTTRRYAGLLSKVFRHLQQKGLRNDNPAGDSFVRLMPPDRRPLPIVLSRQQEASFLALQPDESNWRRLRDFAMMRLILGAGLRLNEVLDLKLIDLYMEDAPPFVHISAHGQYRERVAPIATLAHDAMRIWFARRADLDVLGDLAFPGTLNGETLSAATVYRQTKAAMEQAGIQKHHQGPQVLRDTFCVRQIANGKPIDVVQRWMGHEQEETTARFMDLVGVSKTGGAA